MSRESRTLLILAAMAIGAVAILGYMAYRYSGLVAERGPRVREALEQVDAFIHVRRAMHLQLQLQGATEAGGNALSRVRDQALAESGLERKRYEEIREAYRKWRRSRLERTTPLAWAMEQRRAELRQLDLGDYEPLDS